MAKRAPRGEQTKSESVTARLNPKIKFGLEMLARQQRRSVSAVLETLLEKALTDAKPDLDVDQLWHPSEGIRVLKLYRSPGGRGLLTYEEARALEFLPLVLDAQARSDVEAVAAGMTATSEQSVSLLALETLWPQLKSLAAQTGGFEQSQVEGLRRIALVQRDFLQGRIDEEAFRDQFPVIKE